MSTLTGKLATYGQPLEWG